MLCNLKNKDSILYSELLFAINKFNCGEPKYVVSKKKKKCLKKYCVHKELNISNILSVAGFYYEIYDENILLLRLNNDQLPIININF